MEGKHTTYIKIPYTPDVKLSIDNPVDMGIIILPIVIPTVAFCIPDSMDMAIAFGLSTFNHCEL